MGQASATGLVRPGTPLSLSPSITYVVPTRPVTYNRSLHHPYRLLIIVIRSDPVLLFTKPVCPATSAGDNGHLRLERRPSARRDASRQRNSLALGDIYRCRVPHKPN